MKKKITLKKLAWRIFWIFVIVAVIVYICDGFIFRIYTNPFRPEQEHKGMSYLESGAYLEYEKGELFLEAFSSFDFSDKCTITDFYHINNQHCDSIIYGICPDFYALTLDAGEYYEEIKEWILQTGAYEGIYSFGSKNSFQYEVSFYSVPVASDDAKDLFVFAISEEIPFLRFILVTEYEEAVYWDPVGILVTHADMDWEYHVTGDGSA